MKGGSLLEELLSDLADRVIIRRYHNLVTGDKIACPLLDNNLDVPVPGTPVSNYPHSDISEQAVSSRHAVSSRIGMGDAHFSTDLPIPLKLQRRTVPRST